MTQELDRRSDPDLDALVRSRIRSLRLARGWTLDSLARRCDMSASTLSRIETGGRRVALDQLVPIARALGVSLDQLVEPVSDEDVVIRPEAHSAGDAITWLLSRDRADAGVVVAKMRLQPPAEWPTPRVHPGHEWFTVLSGSVRLALGERIIYVQAGEAAEFSTMTPHAFVAHGTTAEILTIFDRDGERAHLPE
ncbi:MULTISPECIES: helix-turn-helix domain-containing protein [Gordonia]|uniref:Putative Xre family DNA-binding protein n=1 Tax=Gordonia sihwensis NBRC 108236 TaxID=1223544 RepID=L7LFF5_9ACTN|nr:MULTISPECIES: XRE family transcriptional regulator [Gordonia]AUH70339.1 XRE family transcriptional regulator [Gordonia sp. YC-JH1]GAC59619.1 putative Xre family DNA-binding protein [Gordonia sihwensis NBRC 108236]